MTSDGSEKSFDCMKWKRETRDRLSRKMATMTWEELTTWLEGQADRHPFFSRMPKARIVPPRRGPIRKQAAGRDTLDAPRV